MAAGLPTRAAVKGLALAAVMSLAMGVVALGHETKKGEPQPAGTAHEASETTHDQMMSATSAMAGGQGSHVGAGRGPRLIMPIMNSARGRKLFASKACVTCHSINGVGGHDAPPFDAHTMEPYMNPFEFAARMWRGAATMIAVQEDALGFQIEFTGEELADIIAFVHDDEEQHKFTEADIPPEIWPLMQHEHAPPGGVAEHADELDHKHGPAEEDKHND